MGIAILSFSIGPACSDSVQRPGPPFVETMEDSAGVQIIRTGFTAETQSWRISPEPALRLGVVDGEEPYLFSTVRYAGHLSDGRIVVANDATRG